MFGGIISPAAFAWRAGLRVAIYIALTAGFPFVTFAFIKAMGSPGGGASGALAAVFGLYLKPVIHIVFALSLLRISMKRARDIGIPPWFGIAVPLLVFADIGFGVAFGAFWGTTFAIGILKTPFPWFLTTALAIILALSLAPSDSGPRAEGRSPTPLEWLALALVGVLALSVLPFAIGMITVVTSPKSGLATLPLLKPLFWLDLRLQLGGVWPILPGAASLAVVAAGYAARLGGPATAARGGSPPFATGGGSPPPPSPQHPQPGASAPSPGGFGRRGPMRI